MRTTTTIGSALTLALLLVAGEGSLPPTSTEAAWAPCRVNNVSQGTRGHSLKRMVRRSHDGDRLLVRGTCPGEIVISADITIIGRGETPTLTGRDRTRVVWVKRGATVVIKGLRVQRGKKWDGAGIRNAGRLTLRNVIVRKSRAGRDGGGILNGGHLTLISSKVVGNTARGQVGGISIAVGGGISSRGEGNRLTIIDSTVSGNIARRAPGVRGGISVSGGLGPRQWRRWLYVLTVRRSVISANDPGGIGVLNTTASFTDSRISDNPGGTGLTVSDINVTLTRTTVSGHDEGGIQLEGGELDLVDSTVTGNSPWGIKWHERFGRVALSGTSSVTGNVPDDCVDWVGDAQSC